jgi:hypothetical protein
MVHLWYNLLTISNVFKTLFFGEFPEHSKFRLKPYEYGTKIFELKADLYYEDLKIEIYTARPRSAIMSEQFAQLQFENNLYFKTIFQ